MLGYSSPIRFLENWIAEHVDQQPWRHKSGPLEDEIRWAAQVDDAFVLVHQPKVNGSR